MTTNAKQLAFDPGASATKSADLRCLCGRGFQLATLGLNRGASRKQFPISNQIGLPEFFAIEAFVRWNGVPI